MPGRTRPADAVGGRAPSDAGGYMTTAEVAAYLRLKERKIYDLVRLRRIPCARVGGRWLFPRDRIDEWLAGTAPDAGGGAGEAAGMAAAAPPPVIAGSHDPLLDWCVAESGCRLAMAGGGSEEGLARLAAGEAVAAAIHLAGPGDPDGDPDAYNVEAVRQALAGRDVVVLEWARRDQGLVVAPGNPLGIAGPADLARPGIRTALRRPGSGSHLLLERLLDGAGIPRSALDATVTGLRTETEVGMAVLQGRADTGLAVRSVAASLRLDFVPLVRERFDLVIRRRDYFEPPFQALLRFAASPAAAARAADLTGYDLGGLGTVRYNAP